MIKPEDYLSAHEMEAIGYLPKKEALEGIAKHKRLQTPVPMGEQPAKVVFVDFVNRRVSRHRGSTVR